MTARIDRESLRRLVREALEEALGQGASAPPQPGGLEATLRAAINGQAPARIAVPAGDDAALTRFARDIARAAEHEDLKAAIMTGRVTFAPSGDAPPPAQRSTARVASGVLTESRVVELGRTHTTIIAGRDVVTTPLARERAREMKVELVREKP